MNNFKFYTKKTLDFLCRHIGEIAFSIIALELFAFILVHGVSLVKEIGRARECDENMRIIATSLDAELNNTGIQFDDVLYQTRSQKIFDEIKKHSSNDKLKKMDTTEYYFDNNGTTLTLICRRHDDNEPIQVKIPERYQQSSTAQEIVNPSKTDLVNSITVTGVKTYIVGERLDKNNPDKTKFTSKDDLKSIFSDIKVNLQYIGGKTIVLDKNAYKLTTDGFDMNVPGTKTITVEYTTNNNWENTLRGSFTFEVLENSQSPEFIVDFGEKGSSRLASWDWSDYVRDTMTGTDEEMSFGASIVHYNNEYLYYPDGFVISKLRDNSKPETSAADCDNKKRSAYFIKFDPNTIIQNEETDKKKLRNGAMYMDENYEIYIWQTEPSKEASSGWLRVYCEVDRVE